jgi:hypothetical protein
LIEVKHNRLPVAAPPLVHSSSFAIPSISRDARKGNAFILAIFKDHNARKPLRRFKMAKVVLYQHVNYGGWSYSVDNKLEELPEHIANETSSIKVNVTGWITLHSKSGNRGSHLCIKGPRNVPDLTHIAKHNAIPPFDDGNWNDEIVSVDPIPSPTKPYDGNPQATHLE